MVHRHRNQPGFGELNRLLADLDSYRDEFAQQPAAAKKLLAIGERSHNAGLDPAELAAYALVANTILNLDEAIMQN